MGNTIVKGIVCDVHCRRRGKVFVKNFSIVSQVSGTRIASSAWSNSVLNIDTIRDGAFACARGYFKPVSFTRKDGRVYNGREFIVMKIESFPEAELPLGA